MENLVRFATISLAFLAVLETAKADQSTSSGLRHESTQIYSADGSKVVGSLTLSRLEASGNVKLLFFSGPPEMVVAQKEPWTKWHEHSELSDVRLALTSVSGELCAYLAKIKSLESLYIEDCIFVNDAEKSFRSLSMLKTLEIDFATGNTIRDWSFLDGFTKLEELTVVGDVVTADFAEHLSSMASLKTIEFWVDDDTKTKVLPKLSTLPSIKSIRITRVATLGGVKE